MQDSKKFLLTLQKFQFAKMKITDTIRHELYF